MDSLCSDILTHDNIQSEYKEITDNFQCIIFSLIQNGVIYVIKLCALSCLIIGYERECFIDLEIKLNSFCQK